LLDFNFLTGLYCIEQDVILFLVNFDYFHCLIGDFIGCYRNHPVGAIERIAALDILGYLFVASQNDLVLMLEDSKVRLRSHSNEGCAIYQLVIGHRLYLL